MPDQIMVKSEATQSETTQVNQPEKTSIAEQIPVLTVSPNPTVTADDQTMPNIGAIADPIMPKSIPTEEVKSATTQSVQAIDNKWIGKVKEVIGEDRDKPFQEEEDAEALNEAYLKERFGVNIDVEGK